MGPRPLLVKEVSKFLQETYLNLSSEVILIIEPRQKLQTLKNLNVQYELVNSTIHMVRLRTLSEECLAK